MNIVDKLTQLNKWVSNSRQTKAVSFAVRCRCVVITQDGVALVLALLTMMVVSMIGLFSSVTGQTELKVASNEQNAKKALAVADAGVRHALRLLGTSGNGYQNGFNDELSNNGTGGAFAVAGSALTAYPGEATQYRFFQFGGSGSGDGYYIRVVDNNDADGSQNTDTDQKLILISRGKVGTAEKTIEALVSPSTPCAITTGDRLDVSDDVGSSDLQLNTVDGFGACVHANGSLNVSGSASFPDGAYSSLGQPPGNCNGNPAIAGGNCNNVLWNQPLRDMPNTNPGWYGKWVADLGNADPAGPYYILHPATNTIRRGGGCSFTTTPSTAPLLVGQCGSNVPYPSQMLPGAISSVDQAGPSSLTGITLSNANGGTCTFSGNNIPPGIYYCEGIVQNAGQVSGNGVTIISRDDMSFTAQTNLSAFFSDMNNGTNADETATTTLNNLAPSPVKDAALAAMGFLRNLVMMVGNDLNFSGDNTNITGIILIHNQIAMTGGKTISGYIIAADGIPSFPGDPHPAGSASSLNIPLNNFVGTSTVNYMNYGTALPLGPPILRAWKDGQW